MGLQPKNAGLVAGWSRWPRGRSWNGRRSHQQGGDPADLQGRAVFVAALPESWRDCRRELVLQTVHTPLLKFQPLVQEAQASPRESARRRQRPDGVLTDIRTDRIEFPADLSGIATLTRQYVDAVAALPCQILDTGRPFGLAAPGENTRALRPAGHIIAWGCTTAFSSRTSFSRPEPSGIRHLRCRRDGSEAWLAARCRSKRK